MVQIFIFDCVTVQTRNCSLQCRGWLPKEGFFFLSQRFFRVWVQHGARLIKIRSLTKIRLCLLSHSLVVKTVNRKTFSIQRVAFYFLYNSKPEPASLPEEYREHSQPLLCCYVIFTLELYAQLSHYLERHAALRVTTFGEAQSCNLWPWRHLFHQIYNDDDDIYIALNCQTINLQLYSFSNDYRRIAKDWRQTYNVN